MQPKFLVSNIGIFQGAIFFWPRVDGKVQCYVPARRWRQRRNGTRYEILPPQMCRNCIPPTRARCKSLWIVKSRKIYCTFLSRHNKEKGSASLSICQVCTSFQYCSAILIYFTKRRLLLFFFLYIFHHVLDPLSPRLWSITPCIPPLWHIQQISPNMGSMQPHHKMIEESPGISDNIKIFLGYFSSPY